MSNVSLHSRLSRRLAAGFAAAAARGAVWDDEGLETVAEMTRVFIADEEGGSWRVASGWLTLRKLMERCRDSQKISWGKTIQPWEKLVPLRPSVGTWRVWPILFRGVVLTGGRRLARDVTLDTSLLRFLLGSCSRVKTLRVAQND